MMDRIPSRSPPNNLVAVSTPGGNGAPDTDAVQPQGWQVPSPNQLPPQPPARERATANARYLPSVGVVVNLTTSPRAGFAEGKWLSRGVSHEDAQLLAAYGYEPADLSAQLILGEAHLIALARAHVPAMRLREFASATPAEQPDPLKLVRSYLDEGLPARDAVELAAAGVQPDTVQQYRNLGIETGALRLHKRQVTPAHAARLIQRGFDLTSMITAGACPIELIDGYRVRGFQGDDLLDLAHDHVDLHKLEFLSHLGLSVQQICRTGPGFDVDVRSLQSAKFSPREIGHILANGIAPDVAARWRDLGLRVDDFGSYEYVSPHSVEALRELGFDLSSALLLALRKVGLAEANLYRRLNVPVVDMVPLWEPLNSEDLEHSIRVGNRPSEAIRIVRALKILRVQGDNCTRVLRLLAPDVVRSYNVVSTLDVVQLCLAGLEPELWVAFQTVGASLEEALSMYAQMTLHGLRTQHMVSIARNYDGRLVQVAGSYGLQANSILQLLLRGATYELFCDTVAAGIAPLDVANRLRSGSK